MAAKRAAAAVLRNTKKVKKVVEAPKDASDVSESDDSVNSGLNGKESESESGDDLDDVSSASGSDGSDLDEDELDNVASDDEASDQDEGQDGEEESPADAEAKKQKRLEQKRLQKERKLQKAHGKEIDEIKRLWEKMRAKSVAPDVRRKYVDEAYALAESQGWSELVFRHDSSRVVQSILKYATKDQREHITKALRGSYVELAKSSYGKYLLVKMLHYGSASMRAQILDEMHGSFRKLMGHREGAYVIEDAFRDYATAPQRRQMLREFFGSEFAVFKDKGGNAAGLREILQQQPEKRPYLMQNLNAVITAAVNKGSIGFEIVHAAMLEYVRNLDLQSSDRETFVDLVADQIAEMVHTSAGSQVAALVFAMATAKERKRLIRALREFVDKLAKDQYGQFVLTTIFAVVDDTVLVHKAFAGTLEPIMAEMMSHRYARRPFLYLLVGESPKYFAAVRPRFAEVTQFKHLTSKKDDGTRRVELLRAFGPALLAAVGQVEVTDTLGMQFLGDLLANIEGDKTQAVDHLAEAFSGDPSASTHPLKANPICGRVAKLLIRNVPEFATKIADLVEANPVGWSIGEGNFAVIALLEAHSELCGGLKKQLQKNKKEITKKSRAQGRDLLLSLI